MERFRIAEHAIQTFETMHNLIVSVHDLSGTLTPFLEPHRFHHRSSVCIAYKAQGEHFESLCMDFELKRLRVDLATEQEGRVHVCHAGLVEWVVPVFEQGELSWVLFAGPRLPGKSLVEITRIPVARYRRPSWSADTTPLPDAVQEKESMQIMEHLRQLAARLQLWFTSLHLTPPSANGNNGNGTYFANTIAVREITIRLFIEEHFAKDSSLALLAKKLCLSPSRVSHVVRKTCGASFRELLIQKRLRVAAELLRQSGMSVLDVALASGFDDIAHFHRIFKKRLGTTPAQYRAHSRT